MSSTQIDTLEALLQQPGGPPLPELKTALNRLSVEVRDRVRKGSSASYEFFLGAVSALARIRGHAFADLRLECLYESGGFFYRSGFARAALQTSEILARLARQANSHFWMARAASLAGVVQGEAGNIAEAVIQHSNALRATTELGDKEEEARVLINLGTTFNYGSLHQEAIRCFNRVIDLARECDNKSYQAIAYCDLAQSFLAIEEFPAGFECITRSLELGGDPANAREYFGKTIREFTYVQLALELGKVARAREHTAACWQAARWGENNRCRTLAEIASGLCEVYGGDVQRGISTLHGALEDSGDFVVSRIDVLNALVKAHDEVGQSERALQCLKELLSFVKQARSESLTAVMSVPEEMRDIKLSKSDNIQSLELREARLRAKIAEQELVNSRLEMLERLAIAADVKEELSGKHGFRVGKLSCLLAERLRWNPDATMALEIAARLHDIGKIGLPDRILLTSDALGESQRQFITAHSLVGAEILAKSNIAQVQLAEEIARHHHECWDGTGYPSKLSGKRIPIHARIVALADVFDALTHGRPYAPAWPIERAIEEIRNRRGTQFDPELTDTFLELIDELRRKHSDLDAFLGEAGRNSPFLQARDKIRLMLDGERRAENIAAAAAETVH